MQKKPAGSLKELLAKKEELHARYEKLLKEKGVVGERLLQAFPGMESRKYKAALQELKKSMRTVRK